MGRKTKHQHHQINSQADGDHKLPAQNFAEAEELIDHARQRYATAFPNPQRVGCPAPKTLTGIVKAEQLPDEKLQIHLFSCSYCFNYYRTALLVHRQASEAPAYTSGWFNWRAWHVPVLLSGSMILLVAVSWFWRTRQQAPQMSQTRPQPVSSPMQKLEPMMPVIVTKTPAADVGQPLRNAPSSEVESLLALSLDLEGYRPRGEQIRGNAEKETSQLKLPAARMRLHLKVREPLATEWYRITILDNAEQPLRVARARRLGERSLLATLDLRHLSPQEATLRLERIKQTDVAPEEYRLLIVRP